MQPEDPGAEETPPSAPDLGPAPSSSTGWQPGIPSVREHLPSLVFGGALPIGVYFLVRSHVQTDTAGLIIAGCFSVGWIAIQFVRQRRIDVVGAIVLLGFVIGVVSSTLLGGNDYLLKVRDAFFSALFGVACIVTIFTHDRPALFYVGRYLSAGTDPEKVSAFDASTAAALQCVMAAMIASGSLARRYFTESRHAPQHVVGLQIKYLNTPIDEPRHASPRPAHDKVDLSSAFAQTIGEIDSHPFDPTDFRSRTSNAILILCAREVGHWSHFRPSCYFQVSAGAILPWPPTRPDPTPRAQEHPKRNLSRLDERNTSKQVRPHKEPVIGIREHHQAHEHAEACHRQHIAE